MEIGRREFGYFVATGLTPNSVPELFHNPTTGGPDESIESDSRDSTLRFSRLAQVEHRVLVLNKGRTHVIHQHGDHEARFRTVGRQPRDGDQLAQTKAYA
jgi:hypothetical protein